MMKAKMAVICAILITFLIVESCCTPKSKVTPRNWGPQSMLYLKGRYGRRSTEDNGSYNSEINTWNLLLGDYKRTRALGDQDHWKQANAKNINHMNMK
ncbi:spexin prohormone 2-like [Pristis pectinata]|uniref:spexin prohormone 2-like n=1 Tax=Pristis pectinata TaxID=685728 RepID=UPI00223D19E7|nr:spexin prohormone 2-like [Pristis pectinata]